MQSLSLVPSVFRGNSRSLSHPGNVPAKNMRARGWVFPKYNRAVVTDVAQSNCLVPGLRKVDGKLKRGPRPILLGARHRPKSFSIIRPDDGQLVAYLLPWP